MLVRRRYDMTYVQRLSANGNRVPFAGGAQPNTSRQPSPPGSVLDGTAYTKVVSSMPRAPHTALLPIIALCAGLIGLAVLEYRWTAEIARAERDRLRAGMRAAAARFVDDLRRELVGLLPALRPVPFSVHDDAARYARQVEEWAAYLEDSRLRFVLIADEQNGTWRLRRLEHGAFVAAEWTAELQPIRDRLEAPGVPGLRLPPSPFVLDVPALVVSSRVLVPPPRPGVIAGESGRRIIRFSDPPGPPVLNQVLILVLDPGVLRDHLLPALAARHFAGLECDLAVVSSGDPGRAIWTSRSGFPGERYQPDVVASLQALPSFALGLHTSGPGPPPLPGLPSGTTVAGPGLLAWFPGSPDTRPAENPAPQEPGAWQLVVAHRAGSLEAAVARTRARNLGIGLCVLALLGGSTVLLVWSAHRIRSLARQQVAFVAAASHELRTPLAAIRSAGQNLADGVITDPEQVRRYGTVVQREGERLTALVEQTLELSGMLARGRSAHVMEVDPVRLVNEMLAELFPQAHVDVDLPDGLPSVVGDVVALRSALRNLVDNGLRHGGGQWVAIRARVAARDGGRELCFVVEDHGPGLTPGEAARVFEPFYRGALARERRVPGSGLGLSVVRHVAEMHGGRVSVGSAAGGRGAVFTLHLPVAPEGARP